MSIPGIITGSNALEIFRRTGDSADAHSQQGVFGLNPGSTPKYAINRGSSGNRRDAEYRESMARLFIEIPAGEMESFLASVSAETRPLARVLAVASDASGTGGTGFMDFLLTRTQEPFQEKAQIVDTLTDNYVAFYSGQSAPLFQYGGTLLNTYQDDQRVWMLKLYREILRGTRLANRGYVARLRYDSFIVSGYLESLQLGLSGDTEHTASDFAFSIRVKRLNIITAALGAPTVAQTPATTNLILNGQNESESANARTGSVTPDSPPTRLDGPNAESTQLTAQQREEARQQLRAAGLTDEEINRALEQSNQANEGSDIDSREAELMSTTEGHERVSEHVQGTDILESNPDNATADGQLGTSNVRGMPPELVEEMRRSMNTAVRSGQAPQGLTGPLAELTDAELDQLAQQVAAEDDADPTLEQRLGQSSGNTLRNESSQPLYNRLLHRVGLRRRGH